MAGNRFQFGDQRAADVEFRLFGSDRTAYERNLHSQILIKSEVYETIQSERRSTVEWPIKNNITSPCSLVNYIKCIQLMYSFQAGKRFICFSSVNEALAILPVVSDLLFHDCIEECMRYLSAFRWSPSQEAKFRSLLSSLEINALPDLADRLSNGELKSEDQGLQILQEWFQEMLSKISNNLHNRCNRDAVAKYIKGYFEATDHASSAVAYTCRAAILKELSTNLKIIKCNDYKALRCASSALLWVVDMSQRCDGELFESVLKIFCEDAHLPNAVSLITLYTRNQWTSLITLYTDNQWTVQERVDSLKDLRTILVDRIMKALGNGGIITDISFRVFFFTKWLHTIIDLDICLFGRSGKQKLERGVIDMCETLPLVEQRGIYKIWKAGLSRHALNCDFEWWAKKLHGAIVTQQII